MHWFSIRLQHLLFNFYNDNNDQTEIIAFICLQPNQYSFCPFRWRSLYSHRLAVACVFFLFVFRNGIAKIFQWEIINHSDEVVIACCFFTDNFSQVFPQYYCAMLFMVEKRLRSAKSAQIYWFESTGKMRFAMNC